MVGHYTRTAEAELREIYLKYWPNIGVTSDI
jgi:hypothetical protein